MESKFTPGPWKDVQRSSRCIEAPSRKGTTRARVCIVDGPNCEDGESDANCRLIAAAPDLYAACVDALASVEQALEDDPEWAMTAQYLRAALTRAHP